MTQCDWRVSPNCLGATITGERHGTPCCDTCNQYLDRIGESSEGWP